MTGDSALWMPLAALLIPWLCGSAIVYSLLRHSNLRTASAVFGHGFFVGLLLVAAQTRLWYSLGLPVFFPAMLAIPVAVLAVLVWVNRKPVVKPEKGGISGHWSHIVLGLICAVVCYRYYTIVGELLLRPLFAWDAWMNWAPKAIVWFQQGELSPFVSAEEWLTHVNQDPVFTLGNRAASTYPEAVPLIQLWVMLAAGTSDAGIIYLPWPVATLALGAALYGHLRQNLVAPVAAAIGSYLLLSTPYFNLHSALPGYADIWMAGTFGLGVLALQEWEQSGSRSWLALGIFYIIACTQIKMPGIVLSGILFASVLASLLCRKHYKQLAICAAALSVLAIALVVMVVPSGVDGTPWVIDLPLLGTHDIAFHNVNDAVERSLFLSLNWNILWYGFIAMLALKIVSRSWRQPPSITLTATVFSLLFVLFVFYFTGQFTDAINQITLNRALLYSIVPMIFYMFRESAWWRRLVERLNRDTALVKLR